MKFKFLLKKWNVYFLFSYISGFIGIFSFSPYNFWPAALFSIYILLFLNTLINIKKKIIISYIWTLGLFGNGLIWIYFPISFIAKISFFSNLLLIFLFIGYLYIYFLLFSILQHYLFFKNQLYAFIFCIPVYWQITEFLRIFFTGFSWLEYGYSQFYGPLKYLIPVFGINFITFLLLTISSLFLYSIKKNF